MLPPLAGLASGWFRNEVVAVTDLTVAAVPEITPSCTAFRQLSSKFFGGPPAGTATAGEAAGEGALVVVFAVFAAGAVTFASVFAGSGLDVSGNASVFVASDAGAATVAGAAAMFCFCQCSRTIS